MDQVSLKKFKYCHVCGDEANAFNCNGLTCQSCKMFFRRNFSKFEELKCKNQTECCTIDLSSRSHCPRCRLLKCFSIGMRRDKIGKRQSCKANQLISWRINQYVKNKLFESECSENIPKFVPKLYPDDLTPPELEIIQEVQNAMQVFTDENKLRVSRVAQSNIESFNLYANYVRKIIKFCKNIQAFKELGAADQLTTLKGFFFDIAIIRRIYQFDPENDEIRLIDETGEFAVLVNYTGAEEIVPKNHEFFEKFKASLHSLIENDETLRDLIIGQILFRHRDRITCREYVNYEHMIYSRLLRRYLCHNNSNVASAEEKFYTLICLLEKLDQFKECVIDFMLSLIDLHQVDQALKEVLEIQ